MRIKDKQPMKINALHIEIGDFIPARGVVSGIFTFPFSIAIQYTWLNQFICIDVYAIDKTMLIRR